MSSTADGETAKTVVVGQTYYPHNIVDLGYNGWYCTKCRQFFNTTTGPPGHGCLVPDKGTKFVIGGE